MRLSFQTQPTYASAAATMSATAPAPTILAMRRGTASIVGLVLHRHDEEVVLVGHRLASQLVELEGVLLVLGVREGVGERDRHDRQVHLPGIGEDRGPLDLVAVDREQDPDL